MYRQEWVYPSPMLITVVASASWSLSHMQDRNRTYRIEIAHAQKCNGDGTLVAGCDPSTIARCFKVFQGIWRGLSNDHQKTIKWPMGINGVSLNFRGRMRTHEWIHYGLLISWITGACRRFPWQRENVREGKRDQCLSMLFHPSLLIPLEFSSLISLIGFFLSVLTVESVPYVILCSWIPWRFTWQREDGEKGLTLISCLSMMFHDLLDRISANLHGAWYIRCTMMIAYESS